VNLTFNVSDLLSFAGGTNDEADSTDLRTNPFQDPKPRDQQLEL